MRQEGAAVRRSGWWRVVDTEQWVNDGLDDLGPVNLVVVTR